MKKLLILLMVCGGPVVAQSLDCSAAFTQSDMNQCADIGFQDADAALNAIYGDAVSVARMMNQYSDTDTEEALRAAQRAWVTFRDLACDVESLGNEGGSIRPMIYSNCLERLTWQRINDLQIFSTMGG